MKMYEIHPIGALAALLKKFYALGGVIDYVLMRSTTPIPQAYNLNDLHKAAALFTIQTANARHPFSTERGPRIEPDKAYGNQIELAEFFAHPFVWVKTTDFETSPYIEGDIPKLLELSSVKRDGGIYASTGSYAKAFYDPPYGFPESQAEKLFPAINQLLFGDDMSVLTIYRWSDDWADYFNPGHDWWGNYLWTVYNTRTNTFVGIAASATD